MMEEDFWTLLTGSAAIVAVIPSSSIVWGAWPQGQAWPGIVLNIVENIDGLTYAGPDGFWQGRVQVDCYAETYPVAKQLARSALSVLSGHRGGAFRGIFLASTRDHREDGASDRPFRISMDFMTHWRAQ
ncbi:DUF3168 domain-containing protein [Paracoccus alkanivorans]|uniref:DUF3168 domain-containing protein n=1 Tax=Paracoccus alkanivorans TaxID=2116655 RepID=A0A3M0N1A9_9RHOB|nr:DUF3168 domain-containing protein [Paracoccus alkanivorans]RMC37497.1 DUF3168 domain-containing protein [Paracoccus alkanivorans]